MSLKLIILKKWMKKYIQLVKVELNSNRCFELSVKKKVGIYNDEDVKDVTTSKATYKEPTGKSWIITFNRCALHNEYHESTVTLSHKNTNWIECEKQDTKLQHKQPKVVLSLEEHNLLF